MFPGLNSRLTLPLRIMALVRLFSLISLIFLSFLNSGRLKQHDSRLHSFSLSNHSLNLFKRT